MPELKEMRNDIYNQLKAQYTKDPESLSPAAKAVLAVFATTKYMDDYDAKGDMFADMARRLELAEKIMAEIESGNYQGPGDPSNIIIDLVPIDMFETAQGYTHLADMAARMLAVLSRNALFSVNEYERANGLPITVDPVYTGPSFDPADIKPIEELLDEED